MVSMDIWPQMPIVHVQDPYSLQIIKEITYCTVNIVGEEIVSVMG